MLMLPSAMMPTFVAEMNVAIEEISTCPVRMASR